MHALATHGVRRTWLRRIVARRCTRTRPCTLSASFNYNISPNLTLSISGQNLNNPILKNYIFNKDQPSRFYANGAQYYAGLHMKY
jgi:hypothetical protein